MVGSHFFHSYNQSSEFATLFSSKKLYICDLSLKMFSRNGYISLIHPKANEAQEWLAQCWCRNK